MPTSQQETWSHWNHTRSGAGYPLSQAQRCSQGSFPWGRAGCWSWPRLPQLGISWLHFLHSQPHSLNSHQMAGSLSFSPDSHSPFPYLGKTICCFLWWLLPFSSKIWKSISFAFRKWNIWCCLRLKKKKSFFPLLYNYALSKSHYLIISYFTLILIQCVLALDCGFTIDLIFCTTAKYKIL